MLAKSLPPCDGNSNGPVCIELHRRHADTWRGRWRRPRRPAGRHPAPRRIVEDEQGEIIELIYPEDHQDRGASREIVGMLSRAGTYGIVTGPMVVRVAARRDRYGTEFEKLRTKRLTASCFCLEIEHLRRPPLHVHCKVLTDVERGAVYREQEKEAGLGMRIVSWARPTLRARS